MLFVGKNALKLVSARDKGGLPQHKRAMTNEAKAPRRELPPRQEMPDRPLMLARKDQAAQQQQ